jgi:hypothetical protein
MAKASSPIRLQEELMQAAILTGSRMHRSAAEQIEYWASLGRQIAYYIDPDTLLKINAGLAKINIEATTSTPINPDSVFAAVEQDRQNGQIINKVAESHPRYYASKTHPGLLDQISADGSRMSGSFINGKFIQLEINE